MPKMQVDRVEALGAGLYRIYGLLLEDISIGDRFDNLAISRWVYGEPGEDGSPTMDSIDIGDAPISMIVEEIEAYRRKFNTLNSGMSCALTCRGSYSISLLMSS